MRNPQRTSTLVPACLLKSQNIHSGEAGLGLSRTSRDVLTLPAVASSPKLCHISAATECGKILPRLVKHAHASPTFTLHPFGLLLGEQGIRHEGIVPEQGVVEARHLVTLA
jgi:hypothetical protein